LNVQDVRLDMYTSTGLVNLPARTCRATIDSALDLESDGTWAVSEGSIGGR
jgi:hypothetical protein